MGIQISDGISSKKNDHDQINQKETNYEDTFQKDRITAAIHKWND